MSMQEMLRIGDDGRSDALERELKEKLRLRGDASPAKCARQEQRWRSDHGIVDARERFVQAYGRLRDDLVGDDSCELTDEARRWLAQEIFSEFECRCYNHLVTSIEAQKDRAAQEILKSFLSKLSDSLGVGDGQP